MANSKRRNQAHSAPTRQARTQRRILQAAAWGGLTPKGDLFSWAFPGRHCALEVLGDPKRVVPVTICCFRNVPRLLTAG
jgi:hypothetical protein